MDDVFFMPIKNKSYNIPNLRNLNQNTKSNGNAKKNVQNAIATNIPGKNNTKKNGNNNNGKKNGNNNNGNKNGNLKKKYYTAGSSSTPSLW